MTELSTNESDYTISQSNGEDTSLVFARNYSEDDLPVLYQNREILLYVPTKTDNHHSFLHWNFQLFPIQERNSK